MADNGRFRNLISNIEIASIVETVFTNVSWSFAWFPAGVDTPSDAVSTFEDDDLDAMALQDRGSSQTGDARSNHNHLAWLWSAEKMVAGSNIRGRGCTRAQGDDIRKTAVQLFLHLPRCRVALSVRSIQRDSLGKFIGELKDGRTIT